MAQWIKVTARYDHRWPSRAVTSYPPGIYFVKAEVATAAIAKGVAEAAERPDSDEARAAEEAALREQAAVEAAAAAVEADAANQAAVRAAEAEAEKSKRKSRRRAED